MSNRNLSLLLALFAAILAEGATCTVLLVREYSNSAIHRYVLNNPQVIIEAVERYRAVADIAKHDAQDKLIAKYVTELDQDSASPVGGNPYGKHVAVEFVDYQCHYCKAVASALDQTLQSDHQAKIIYKEFPILGDASEVAARAVLAARKLGRYEVLHHALLAAKGPLTEQQIKHLAEQAGLSWSTLTVVMKDSEIDAEIYRNKLLAQELGIKGTPTFIINGKYTETNSISDENELLRLLKGS